MAQTGFTPIQLYYSTTASAVPIAGNLQTGELAANVTDQKLYSKNGGGSVVKMAVSPAGDTMTGPLAQAAGTAALPSYTFSGDTNTGMWSPGADILAWSTAGSERLRIDASGNVGVGATPTAQMDQYSLDSTAYNGAATDGQLTAGATHLIRAAAGANTNVAQVVFQARGGQPYNRIVSSGGSAPFMAFVTNNAERMRIDSNGNVLVTGSGGLGYGVGSGGTVTQATSKSTAVTLNKSSGKITMDGANLNANSTVLFTFTNSAITAKDILLLTIQAGSVSTTASYNVWATADAGSAIVALRNITAGNLAEAVAINFAVIKGETS